MIYFDTDILVHYLINQDKTKHALSTKLFNKAFGNNKAFFSLLSLQEIAFVLSKLDYSNFEITEYLEVFQNKKAINYTYKDYCRAIELSNKVGFRNFNDCLHTAIAESHCKELYTFNKKDFEIIKKYTDLKISIL